MSVGLTRSTVTRSAREQKTGEEENDLEKALEIGTVGAFSVDRKEVNSKSTKSCPVDGKIIKNEVYMFQN